ncbi:DUF5791 family protein [Halorussus salilacus]|uniref:DUF5791 family protein n=1 Tax=Halorussus salilacus TaxID=2953750 RepID=UPI0020A10B73|nr:DUF5791 family protein [Halorussus salilacus]USZ68915.1 DUF5791 family protein [Halorussus salilacus]
MLYDDIEDPESVTPAQLRAEYLAELAAVIDELGVDAVAEESGVDRELVAAVAAGEEPTVELADAAAVLAVDDGTPPEDAILLETRDHLLLGMTTAVLDVDTIAAEMDDMDGKQVQQKIEGRAPMTLAEYARLHRFIAGRQD